MVTEAGGNTSEERELRKTSIPHSAVDASGSVYDRGVIANVYSDPALLPQDFEFVFVASQEYPEAEWQA
jgi:hypothetical protein